VTKKADDDSSVERALKVLGSITARECDLSEVAQAMVSEFGGPDGLAQASRSVYEGAPGGSQVRANIIRQVLGIVEKHASINKQSISSESGMTDEELLAEAAPLIGLFDTTPTGDEDDPPSATGPPAASTSPAAD
jgi:hypothetical protein